MCISIHSIGLHNIAMTFLTDFLMPVINVLDAIFTNSIEPAKDKSIFIVD